jgi:hypothetical protein
MSSDGIMSNYALADTNNNIQLDRFLPMHEPPLRKMVSSQVTFGTGHLKIVWLGKQ